MTMIARVVDGLPLVGTMQEDEQVSGSSWLVLILLIINDFFYYSPGGVYWSTRTRLKCCSES